MQALICLVDKKTGEKSKTRPRFVKQDQVAIMRIECSGVICLEQFKLFPQMGRFTLRDESEYFVSLEYLVIKFALFTADCLCKIEEAFVDKYNRNKIIKRMLQLHLIADRSEVIHKKKGRNSKKSRDEVQEYEGRKHQKKT